MKKNIIYSVFVILLICTPLLMPQNGHDYSFVPVSIFVVLCYAFKIQSIVKIIIPVITFSAILPAFIQLTIFKSIPLSWGETISNFISSQTVGSVLSHIIPTAIALTLYLILGKFPFVTRNN